MTQEEKAKAYEEAIKIAKEELKEADAIEYNLPDSAHAIRTTVYSLFPELKESEEKIRKHIIEILRRLAPCHFDGNERSECIAWLEKQGEQKPAWSEEDERIRIETIELLETANHPNKMHSNGKPLDFTENINWLKSLKPQSHWKPSEKQLKALQGVYDWYMSHYPQNKEFESLFDDLLKL